MRPISLYLDLPTYIPFQWSNSPRNYLSRIKLIFWKSFRYSPYSGFLLTFLPNSSQSLFMRCKAVWYSPRVQNLLTLQTTSLCRQYTEVSLHCIHFRKISVYVILPFLMIISGLIFFSSSYFFLVPIVAHCSGLPTAKSFPFVNGEAIIKELSTFLADSALSY